jgi:hypothetical protein
MLRWHTPTLEGNKLITILLSTQFSTCSIVTKRYILTNQYINQTTKQITACTCIHTYSMNP